MRISSIGCTLVSTLFLFISSLPGTCGGSDRTYRWVQIDEDGARNIFAVAGLCEESIVGTGLTDVRGVWVQTPIGFQAMLEQVAINRGVELALSLSCVVIAAVRMS